MEIRIAGIVPESIVDGPGLRLAVFTQGCPHACPGCHNPHTHDFSGGEIADTDQIIARVLKNPLLDGVTLTGGEPFCQSAACREIAMGVKKAGLNVWAYSGYLFEEILADDAMRSLLECVDVLIDGPFIMDQRSLELRFRGSRNQRVIDVQASIAAGEVVIIPDK